MNKVKKKMTNTFKKVLVLAPLTGLLLVGCKSKVGGTTEIKGGEGAGVATGIDITPATAIAVGDATRTFTASVAGVDTVLTVLKGESLAATPAKIAVLEKDSDLFGGALTIADADAVTVEYTEEGGIASGLVAATAVAQSGLYDTTLKLTKNVALTKGVRSFTFPKVTYNGVGSFDLVYKNLIVDAAGKTNFPVTFNGTLPKLGEALSSTVINMEFDTLAQGKDAVCQLVTASTTYTSRPIKVGADGKAKFTFSSTAKLDAPTTFTFYVKGSLAGGIFN